MPDLVVLDDLDGTLTAVNPIDGSVRWTRAVPRVIGLPAAAIPVTPDRILIASVDAVWMVDAATGRAVWSVGTGPGPSEVPVAVTSQHVVTILADPDGGDTATFRVRPLSGAVLSQFAVPDAGDVRELAITEAQLLLRLPDELVAFDLDDGTVAWRRGVHGRLMASRPLRLSAGVLPGPLGVGTIALRTWSVVVLGSDGTATVLDPRNGRDARRIGEPGDGVQLSDGFLTQRRLWRIDASSLEVVDLLSLEVVLRLELRAPPVVVSTDPVIIATSGRLVRLDASHPADDTAGEG